MLQQQAFFIFIVPEIFVLSRAIIWLAITSTSENTNSMVASAFTSGETPTFTIE